MEKGEEAVGREEEDQQHGGAHAEDQAPVTLLSGRAREVRRWLEMVAMVDGFGGVWWVVEMARWSWWRWRGGAGGGVGRS